MHAGAIPTREHYTRSIQKYDKLEYRQPEMLRSGDLLRSHTSRNSVGWLVAVKKLKSKTLFAPLFCFWRGAHASLGHHKSDDERTIRLLVRIGETYIRGRLSGIIWDRGVE